MKFNRFIFDNYLQTKEGQEASNFFKEFRNKFSDKKIEELVNFVNKQYFQETSKEIIKEIIDNVNDSVNYQLDNYSEENNKVCSLETAETFFEFFIKITIKNLNDLTTRQILTYITDISLVLHFLHPDYFFRIFL
jgi:transcriptional regulator of heat shock response